MRVIAVDAGRQLGRHHVAALELLAARRRHALHLDAADADDLEVVVDAVGAEERLGLRHQLVVGAAEAGRLHEHLVAGVGELGGLADRGDLAVELVHQQAVDEAGLVGDLEFAGARGDPARQQPLRRGAHAPVAHPVERRIHLADQVRREDDLDAGTIERGAVGLQRAVDVERDMAVAAHDRQRLAFEDAEVGGVAEIIALPGVAVDQQRVEAGLLHRVGQALAAFVGDHGLPFLVTTPAATSCAIASGARFLGSP